jgi:hypothetical protein
LIELTIGSDDRFPEKSHAVPIPRSGIIPAVRALTALGLLALLPAVVPKQVQAQVQAQVAPLAPAGPKPLGRLEQESVDEALAAYGLRVDPAPEGKVIRAIHISNQEVFSRRDWWFQFLNHFHRTTRDPVLRRELLMKPGDRYDEAIAEETTRNLQTLATLTVAGRLFTPPELSSVVAIVPVVSPRPGTVDLLVVTRDVWSLRFNTNFEFQQGTLITLQTSLSENNLFGWRKFLSLELDADQGSFAVGPTYFDPNIHGTRLQLYAVTELTFARDTYNEEGNIETVSLRYPLYSLASRWGAAVDVNHQNVVIRSFQGLQLRPVPVEVAPRGVALVPYMFRRDITTVDVSGVRSFGTDVIQRVSLGYLVDSRASSVLPNFQFDPAIAASFLNQVAPMPETRSEPYVRYQMFTPRYVVFRDLNTFDLRENRQLGPSLQLRVGYGLPALGATYRGPSFGGIAGFAAAPRGSFEQAQVQVGARLPSTGMYSGEVIDQFLKATLYVATPILARTVRLVLSSELDAVRNDTARTLFFLGGSTGLRGYIIGEFQGTAMSISHAELRTVALPIFSQRFGALLFVDVGDAAPSVSQLTAYEDVGAGLRWLIPQLNSSVLRFDWAFALRDGPFTRAGWPGRFSAGFEQVF